MSAKSKQVSAGERSEYQVEVTRWAPYPDADTVSVSKALWIAAASV